MTVAYFWPCIRIHFIANEIPTGHTYVQLADEYSYERLFINQLTNITELYNGAQLTFPPVNCKSPSRLYLYIPDPTKEADIRLTIEKFGQIPDAYYFDKAFDPILVTGNDGNKYNVIPSDQFK